jgi:putative PEP-CTERM system integral membrane protein
MYMWLSWQQMARQSAAGDGWQMPGLAFLRNVYWDDESQRLVNGTPMEVGAEDWLPERLSAVGSIQPQAHRVDLPGGQTVLAIPADQASLPSLPDDVRLAVVIDRSRSMQEHAAEVTSTLEQLKMLPGLKSPVDVYLTASPYRGEEPSVVPLETLDPQEILYFGGQNAAQLIAQFDSLHSSQRSDQDYDAVIVLTDGTGYELGASGIQAPVQSTPIWVAHMGGDIPIGYDDQTLEAIQASGGGVAGSLDEILGRIAVSLNAQTDAAAASATITDLLDGYLWTVLPTTEVDTAIPTSISVQTHSASEPFAALAGRRVILAEIQRQRGTIDELDTLDALHALATNYQIVTPYSSMIVLVSSAQQLQLDRLSQGNDRYQREVEALGETNPGSPLPLTGVPEPHEWLLLGLAAALLIYIGYKRRFALLRV